VHKKEAENWLEQLNEHVLKVKNNSRVTLKAVVN